MMKLCWINDGSDSTREQFGYLAQTCGYMDFETRGRLCLTGEDRTPFLHGQVTQDVKSLAPGAGTFSALADGKGKIQADLNIYCLTDELLLDFEPGLTECVQQRLERYLVSEDAAIMDPSEFYTMISLQGPLSAQALQKTFTECALPVEAWSFTEVSAGEEGSTYICNRPRCGFSGFDVFLPKTIAPTVSGALQSAVHAVGGGTVSDHVLHLAGIVAGVPKMGVDMNDACLVQETGLETQAVSYQKGCYIGQEVISRIRTMGKVNKSLRELNFLGIPQLKNGMELPVMSGDQIAGFVTSAAVLPMQPTVVRGLGYIKRAFLASDTALTIKDLAGSKVDVTVAGPTSATGCRD